MTRPQFRRRLINWEHGRDHVYRTLFRMAILIVCGVCLLAVLIPLGLKYHPFIVFYGFASFAATFALIWLFGVVCAITSMIAQRRIQVNQNDPHLKKLTMSWNKFGLILIAVWLAQLIIVALVLIKKGY